MYLDDEDRVDNETCEAVLKYVEKYDNVEVVF